MVSYAHNIIAVLTVNGKMALTYHSMENATVQTKISLIEVLKTSYCRPDAKMQNLKEKNEITASKIKQ